MQINLLSLMGELISSVSMSSSFAWKINFTLLA